MRYLPLINLEYLAFFLAETDVYKKYNVKLFTEDACVACAALTRSVSLNLHCNKQSKGNIFSFYLNMGVL